MGLELDEYWDDQEKTERSVKAMEEMMKMKKVLLSFPYRVYKKPTIS